MFAPCFVTVFSSSDSAQTASAGAGESPGGDHEDAAARGPAKWL